MSLKRTALYREHLKLGAKMVDFAGWEMPVMYSSIVEEHTATREKASLFDVSHMGEFRVKGAGASDFLRNLIPTRLNKISPHGSMYSVLCNENGGVIDDLFIYMVEDTEFFLVVNAGTADRDFEWLLKHKSSDVEIINESADTAKIDLQGPVSGEVMGSIIDDDRLVELPRFNYDMFTYKGKNIMISQSGYTGEFGYEIYLPNDTAVAMWNDILEAGKGHGVIPAGLGARDTLRLESCYSLYGHELSEDINPVEAGLSWLISSQGDYTGKDVLEGLKASGAARELITFELTGKGVPRGGYTVRKDGEDIGFITSGGFSPTLEKGIGMALVASGSASIGDDIAIEIRNRQIPARVVKRPFYEYNG